MSLIVKSFNLFLDTERNLKSNCRGDCIQLNMSGANISVGDNQFIRLVLKNFSMMKTWTDINANNNTFRMKSPLSGGSYQEITLASQNYSSIKSLATELASKINAQLIVWTHYASGTITINNPQGTSLDSDTDNIIDFSIKTNVAHGLSPGQLVIQTRISDGDAYAVIGGDRILDDTSDTPSITVAVPSTTELRFTCKYHAQLFTEPYLFLHSQSQTDSLQTSSYNALDTDTPNSGSINQSTILAKIPVDRDVIAYDAQTDEYFINLSNNTLHNLTLDVRDSKGRRFPLQGTNQASLGNRNFNCVLEIQIREYSKALTNQLNTVVEQLTAFGNRHGILSSTRNGDQSMRITYQ